MTPFDPTQLFSLYMQATGVPQLKVPCTSVQGPQKGVAGPEPVEGSVQGYPKKLGIVNGGSWTNLWSTYFGKKALPDVQIIQVGNEAVQLNFMRAHHNNEPCPPQINIDVTIRYAEDLVNLYQVDAILLSCSTMNRAAPAVREAMKKHNVSVIQIDEPMMEAAVNRGGKVLVVATHGPTVKSTQALLKETAERLGKTIDFAGATVEEAFEMLGGGDIEGHNKVIARAIRDATAKEKIDQVVLAQLSMTVFKLSYPDCEKEFGMPVLTSGELGFEKVGEILSKKT